jgi:hypothetical protein
MIYKLSTIKSNYEGFERLADLWTAAQPLYSGSLELDLSECQSFDANMAAPLGAVLALVADRFNSIEIVRVPLPIENSLRRNGFLRNYRYPSLEAGPTVIPFLRIQQADERLFAQYLNRHLPGKGFPRITQGAGKFFQQGIFEVFQNAVTHAESRVGIFVCGQFYPPELRLDITISDAGVGIREKVRRFLKDDRISSAEAIEWALRGGHTTRTGARPGGVGLKVLYDFVKENRGTMQIRSGTGFYEYDRESYTLKLAATEFPGTAVNLEVNTADTRSYRRDAKASPESIF